MKLVFQNQWHKRENKYISLVELTYHQFEDIFDNKCKDFIIVLFGFVIIIQFYNYQE